MTAVDGSWPLQQAVFAALTGDSAVAALVGTRVYDAVPPDAVFPYVTIGEDTAEEAGTKSTNMDWHTFNVHAWSRWRGQGEAKRILAAAKAVLHRGTLSMTGFALVEMQFEYATYLLDPDGLTHHGVHRYRALIQATG